MMAASAKNKLSLEGLEHLFNATPEDQRRRYQERQKAREQRAREHAHLQFKALPASIADTELTAKITMLKARIELLERRNEFLEPLAKIGVEREATESWRVHSGSEILESVCAVTKVSQGELRGANRSRPLVNYRHLTCFLMRELTGLSFPQIAMLLSGRDHTTILSGYRRFMKLAQTNEKLVDIMESVCLDLGLERGHFRLFLSRGEQE